jgi:multidrug transporter EmrE-like cation transporter
MSWCFLLIAGMFEIGFTTCLRYTEGFKNLPWTAAFLVCAILSFTFLSVSARTISLGTAYAIWTGMGALGTVVIGMMWFGEPHHTIRCLLLIGLISCVIGLKITSSY